MACTAAALTAWCSKLRVALTAAKSVSRRYGVASGRVAGPTQQANVSISGTGSPLFLMTAFSPSRIEPSNFCAITFEANA